MTWTARTSPWLNGPWIKDDYYPWQADSLPWLLENADTDWTPRS